MNENNLFTKILLIGTVLINTFNSNAQEETTTPVVAIPILKYKNQPSVNGSYSWKYETGNGIIAQEEGFVKNTSEEGKGSQFAKGSFSYMGPNKQSVELQYTADENGFVPVASHLPTPPPIPPEILAALEKNAADEAAGIFDDGKYKYDGSGKYKPDDRGKYKPDSSGKYKPDSNINLTTNSNTDLQPQEEVIKYPQGGTLTGGTGELAPPRINT